jgi:hypothetical protein
MYKKCPDCGTEFTEESIQEKWLSDEEYVYVITCDECGWQIESESNLEEEERLQEAPDEDESGQAMRYAELETSGDLRAFEHADTFGLPGGTVHVYMGIDEGGTAFWVVDGAGFVNIYAIEECPNIEGLVQAHADVERELINRQNSGTEE